MGGKPNTMNCSCLIPAMAGGLLAVLSLQPVSSDRSSRSSSQHAVVPAVVRIFNPTPAAHLASSPHGWSSIERQLERSPEDFRNQASQEIETCALALDGLTRRANVGTLGTRSYLQTRLQALREHVDYARSELIKLPASQGDEHFIPAHAHFHRTMKSLEHAFAQAATELNGDL